MTAQLGFLDLTVFFLCLGVVVWIGLVAARRGVGTARDYFLAGDKLPWWMIGGSILAANLSSQHMVGSMGVAYHRGFVAMTMEWGAILLGLNVLLWIFLPYYFRNGFYTMPEYLNRRFGKTPRLIYAVLILMTYLLVEVGVVLYIGGITLQALLDVPSLKLGSVAFSPVSVSIWIMTLAAGIYTVGGGLRAVVWTELFQLLVLLAGGLVLAVAAVMRIGGPAALVDMSREWQLMYPANDPDFPWTSYFGGGLCVSVFYFATNQFIVQRVLAAKDEWHARMGVVFTCYLKFLVPVIIILPGLAAIRIYSDLEKPDLVFPSLVRDLLPSGLVGLVMAGLVAAVMSHISGVVNSCSTIAAMDFYVPLRNRRRKDAETSGAADRDTVRFARMFAVASLLVGVVLAEMIVRNSDKPIFLYVFNAYGYFTPGIAAMFLAGIFWKRATHAGAVAAGLLTIPLSLFLDWSVTIAWLNRFEWTQWFMCENGLPFQNRTGIVFWCCMLTCVLVSLATEPKTEEELAGLTWKPGDMRLPESGTPRSWYCRPVIWWGVIVVLAMSMYLVYGVIPLFLSSWS